MRHLFACLLLLAPAAAFAQGVAPPTRVAIVNDGLSGVALNAAAATRTLTLTLYTGTKAQPEFAKVRLGIFYTYSAATTVTVLFSCSMDGTNYAQVMARNVSGTTATLSKLTDSWTTGGASATDPGLGPEFDVRGCLKAKFLFGGAGAGSGDLVTVDAAMIAGD